MFVSSREGISRLPGCAGECVLQRVGGREREVVQDRGRDGENDVSLKITNRKNFAASLHSFPL